MACFPLCDRGSKSLNHEEPQRPNTRVSNKSEFSEPIIAEISMQEQHQLTTTPANPTNVREVWQEVHALERQHSASSKYRNFGRTLKPVVDFFEKFAPAFDSAVQYGSTPSTLAWGALKGVIIVYLLFQHKLYKYLYC